MTPKIVTANLPTKYHKSYRLLHQRLDLINLELHRFLFEEITHNRSDDYNCRKDNDLFCCRRDDSREDISSNQKLQSKDDFAGQFHPDFIVGEQAEMKLKHQHLGSTSYTAIDYQCRSYQFKKPYQYLNNLIPQRVIHRLKFSLQFS